MRVYSSSMNWLKSYFSPISPVPLPSKLLTRKKFTKKHPRLSDNYLTLKFLQHSISITSTGYISKYRVSHQIWQFWMSSSIYCIRHWRLFVVYFVKTIFYSNIFYVEISFTLRWLPYNIFIIISIIKRLNKGWKKTF